MRNVVMYLSEVIADKLSEKVNLTSGDRDVIYYQLKMMMSEYIMFLAMLIVAVPFGQCIEFIVAYISMRFTRTYIGGIHQETSIGCCIHTSMFFAAVLLCSGFFDSMELKVVFPLLFVIDLILAPIPSKERGRFGESSKLRMKLMAGVGLLVCLLLCVVLCDYQKTILTTLLFVHVEFLFKAVRERRRLCLNYYVN